jgi:uncharacterized membrane protein
MLKIPRKNSRQWKTAIKLINADHDKWFTDVGFGHAAFVDDISRLRDKGWPIDAQLNNDGFSHSYRLEREKWERIENTLEKFW